MGSQTHNIEHMDVWVPQRHWHRH